MTSSAQLWLSQLIKAVFVETTTGLPVGIENSRSIQEQELLPYPADRCQGLPHTS